MSSSNANDLLPGFLRLFGAVAFLIMSCGSWSVIYLGEFKLIPMAWGSAMLFHGFMVWLIFLFFADVLIRLGSPTTEPGFDDEPEDDGGQTGKPLGELIFYVFVAFAVAGLLFAAILAASANS